MFVAFMKDILITVIVLSDQEVLTIIRTLGMSTVHALVRLPD